MSTPARERFLFVVTVNTDAAKAPERIKAYTDRSRLQAFTAQIDNQTNAQDFIAQVQQRFWSAPADSALARAEPKLLAIDWYEDTFVSVLDLNPAGIVAETRAKEPDWRGLEPTVPEFVRDIFRPLNDAEDEDFSYLIWAVVRLQPLAAPTIDHFSLLGMKGIGGEKK